MVCKSLDSRLRGNDGILNVVANIPDRSAIHCCFGESTRVSFIFFISVNSASPRPLRFATPGPE
jgi:hypothetical protein